MRTAGAAGNPPALTSGWERGSADAQRQWGKYSGPIHSKLWAPRSSEGEEPYIWSEEPLSQERGRGWCFFLLLFSCHLDQEAGTAMETVAEWDKESPIFSAVGLKKQELERIREIWDSEELSKATPSSCLWNPGLAHKLLTPEQPVDFEPENRTDRYSGPRMASGWSMIRTDLNCNAKHLKTEQTLAPQPRESWSECVAYAQPN